MNLIDLLMTEHVALRVHFLYSRDLNRDRIFEIDTFLTNSHAKIEDEVVFPRIAEASSNEELVARAVKKYKEEHALISSFGENMRVWAAEGEAALFRERIGLYIDTVASHNVDEEVKLFPKWSKVSEELRKKSLDESKQIIHDFGFDRYFMITGISRELLESSIDQEIVGGHR
jgi:hemerythrin superfamily protein